ncbi:hypothetical protein BAG01nite_12950 [Brevibacillus agri]|uniref:Uncharacterized protein n=1 Tax=Brevibacillus agri TaxID=51101 RepID=A0A3M8ASF2_9BACL|nr:hypothetical protein [Brevibacillus agri]MDN4094168.1 hypothetical protein [Brevibacillus agri]QAV13229.1 hypothetical protein BA6348_10990 [Brevibacillus agri]RNB54131.1 hypothetical protein EB820_14555 [Brevibacillus agri]GED25193.1 hypothetical protein BAG01nite_12950 [Brevibacillus agri]
MSLALRLWRDDTLHEELQSITLRHISLAKEFSEKATTTERRQAIMQEIEALRQKRNEILNHQN